MIVGFNDYQRRPRYGRTPEPPEYLQWTYAFTEWTCEFHWPTGLWLAVEWQGGSEDEHYGFETGYFRVRFDDCQSSEEWEESARYDEHPEEAARQLRRDFAETHYYLEQWEKRNYRTAWAVAKDLLDEGVDLDDLISNGRG